jgi:flagellar motor switch protein FliM
MADILSKEEMEALTKTEAGDKNAVQGKIIRPYDFHSPERFSKEHLRIFQILTDGFCNRLKKQLSMQLRLENLDITITGIKQTTFKEFLALPSPTYIALFSVQPLDGRAAIEIETAFLIYLMECLLGSKSAQKPQGRDLTQLEIELSNSFSNKILSSFSESFEKVIKFTPRIETVESNPQFAVIASIHEANLLLTFQITIGEISGIINICLPYLVLESLIPHLSIKRWFMNAQKKTDADIEQMLREHLGNTPVDVICEMGAAEVTLRELCSLQVGDYIRLSTHKESLLELQVGGLTKFEVQIGTIGKRLAAKVVRHKD